MMLFASMGADSVVPDIIIYSTAISSCEKAPLEDLLAPRVGLRFRV